LFKNLTGAGTLVSFFAGVLACIYYGMLLKWNADKPDKVKKYQGAIKNVVIVDGMIFGLLFISWIALQIVQSYLGAEVG
jgi:hypothetical protein